MKKPHVRSSPNPSAAPQPTTQPPAADGPTLMKRVAELLDADQPAEALRLLEQSGRAGDSVRNARGVCLLRLGRYKEAAKVYEDLLFPGDTVNVSTDTPTVYRVNYAVTLLLLDEPTLAASHLYHVRHARHPAIGELGAVMRNWKRSLPLWRRIGMLFASHPPFTPPIGFRPGWL